MSDRRGPLFDHRRCLVCETSLLGRRMHAKTCSRRCRQALARNGGKPPSDSSEAVTPPLLRALRLRAVAALCCIDTARSELSRRPARAAAFVGDARAELQRLLVELDAAAREVA